MTREEKLQAVTKAYEALAGVGEDSLKDYFDKERRVGCARLAFEVEDCAVVREGSIRHNESGVAANEAIVASETKRLEAEQERLAWFTRSLELQEQHFRRFEEILREGLSGIAKAVAGRP